MTRIYLKYTDANSVQHIHSIRLTPYQWGLLIVQDDTAQAARYTAWTNAIKPICATSHTFTAMGYINDVGAIVREYVPGSPVVGTKAVTRLSASFSLAFVQIARAAGQSDKSKRSVSRLFVGHNDYDTFYRKQILPTQFAAIDTYTAYLRTLPLGVKGTASATLQANVPTQYNAYWQRKRGS